MDNPPKPKKLKESVQPAKRDTLERYGEKPGALPHYNVGATCLVGPNGCREIEVVDLVADQPGDSQHTGILPHLNNFHLANATSGTKATGGMAPSLGLDQGLPQLTSVGTRGKRKSNEGDGLPLIASLFHEKKVQDRDEETPQSAIGAYDSTGPAIATSDRVAIKSQGQIGLDYYRASGQRFF